MIIVYLIEPQKLSIWTQLKNNVFSYENLQERPKPGKWSGGGDELCGDSYMLVTANIRLPKVASEHFFLQGITLILIADRTLEHLLG